MGQTREQEIISMCVVGDKGEGKEFRFDLVDDIADGKMIFSFEVDLDDNLVGANEKINEV
eukprot:11444250-Ditylum_brightwellii.AAC.1